MAGPRMPSGPRCEDLPNHCPDLTGVKTSANTIKRDMDSAGIFCSYL